MSVSGVVPGQLYIESAGGGGGDIYYDGNDNDPSFSSPGGMGSIDLTQGSRNDRLRFEFTSASNIPATLLIDVKNFGIGSTLQVNLPRNAGIFDIPFSSFSNPDVFSTVGMINLHFEIHGTGTYTIDHILAVPEPCVPAAPDGNVGPWLSPVCSRFGCHTNRRWSQDGGFLVYPTRERVAGTFYTARRRRKHQPAAAIIISTKVDGSGMAAWEGEAPAESLPLPVGWPKWVRHAL